MPVARRRAGFFVAAFVRFAVFAVPARVALRACVERLGDRAFLRADARAPEPERFFEEARFRAWLEVFCEALGAFRRAVFFAIAL
jgi:hypothetical protein